MNATTVSIVSAVIAFLGLVVNAVVVVTSAKNTQQKVTNELHEQNAVQAAEMEHMKKDMEEMKTDIKEHNHYARMFSEALPVLKEKISVANHRIEDLEKKVE